LQIKQQLAKLKPYQPGKPIEEVKKEFGLNKVTKLASNENPFGSSNRVKEALQKEAASLALYPDGYCAALREKLAAFLQVSEQSLIFGNGSDEVIQIVSRALLDQHSNTVMPTPSFPQYKHNAVIEGAEIREIELLEDGSHDLKGMLDAIDENTKIVWICTPNNPTGTYVKEKEFKEFLSNVPKHVLVVSDEAYYEYVDAEDYPETIPLLEEYPNLLILRTFSKAYGLAALRVGYGIGRPEFLQTVEPAREPFNVNSLAQIAAITALEDQDFIKDTVSKCKEGLAQYERFCKENGLGYYPSQTNFILIDFKRDADELFQALLEKGYIVRSGSALGFPTSLRITIGTREQNEEIIQILKELL
jgi:histidinol-phosphate aminotransferase